MKKAFVKGINNLILLVSTFGELLVNQRVSIKENYIAIKTKMGKPSRRYVAKGVPGGWRIWNNLAKQWWDNFMKDNQMSQ